MVVVMIEILLVGIGLGWWIRREMERHDRRVLARGCQFFEGVPEHLRAIDGRLDAVESQAGEAAAKAETASRFAAEAADRKARQERVDGAAAMETRGFGRRF